MDQFAAHFPAHAYLASTSLSIRTAADVARFKARLLRDAMNAVVQHPERKPARLALPAALVLIEQHEFDAFLERTTRELLVVLPHALNGALPTLN